jgi:lysophospholipase L1-like esterase
MTRAWRARRLAAAAAYGGGGLTVLGAFVYGVLIGEAKLAERTIGERYAAPPDADGTYGTGRPDPLGFIVLGDSLACGLGVADPAETPAALVATGVSAVAERPVHLTNRAVSGAESRDLRDQCDKALADAPGAELALILIGANDVTHRIKPAVSVRHLDRTVRRLRAAGAEVVVGTCPDLGTIEPIAQPLRWLARRWSRQLAAAQTIAVVEAGARTVALADLLGRAFAGSPKEMFGPDRFHPSARGYADAAAAVLPSACAALGLWPEAETLPDVRRGESVLPVYLAAAEAVEEPGTEVAGTEVAGRERGPRGRWTTLMRRPRGVAPGAPDAEPAGGR